MAAIQRVSGSGGSSGAYTPRAEQTVYATTPPEGLAPIAANGTSNDAAALQAMLDYVHTTYGKGRVVLPSKTVKCNSGISVPSQVTLVLTGCVLDYSGMATTGAAITITGADYVPLIGGTLIGPQSNKLLTNTSVGIKVVNGVRLRFYDCKIRDFGRGLDWASSNTWPCSMVGGSIEACGTCVYSDNVGASASNAGENMLLDNVTLYNSGRCINVTGNGVNFQLRHCSLDYCAEFGYISNAWVYFTGCHLESRAGNTGTPGEFLFDVRDNSKMSFVNCDIIMGEGLGSPPERWLNHLFDPTRGPVNFGNGQAHFTGTKIFAVNPAGGDVTQFSEQLFIWPDDSTTTSITYFTPFPLRWCAVSAQTVAQDFLAQDTATVRVSGIDYNAGTFTLTVSSPGFKFIRVQFS